MSFCVSVSFFCVRVCLRLASLCDACCVLLCFLKWCGVAWCVGGGGEGVWCGACAVFVCASVNPLRSSEGGAESDAYWQEVLARHKGRGWRA